MYYRKSLLDGSRDGTNEGWNEDAKAFERAAHDLERGRKSAIGQEGLDHFQIGRLFEYAAAAYLTAEAHTLGHGKSARYEQAHDRCARHAAFHYAKAIEYLPNWKDSKHIVAFIKEHRKPE